MDNIHSIIQSFNHSRMHETSTDPGIEAETQAALSVKITNRREKVGGIFVLQLIGSLNVLV